MEKKINKSRIKKHTQKHPIRRGKTKLENELLSIDTKELKPEEQIESEKKRVIEKITGESQKQEEKISSTNLIIPDELVKKTLEPVAKNLKKEEKEVLKERITIQLVKEKIKHKRKIVRNLSVLILSLILGGVVYLSTKSLIGSAIFFTLALLLFIFSSVIKKKLEKSNQIKTMETVFPDFIELVASNLRAGMTVEKSLLLSSRKEFSPLDKEILKLGKDVATGKEINLALHEMGERIGSEKISKTINLITSGIKSGGNMSILLNETAVNMRQRDFIEKKAASNIIMYKIFIIFAISVGAPILFALSSVLVEIMHNLLSNVSVPQGAALSVPFTISQINISTNFVIYFALFFLIITDILASFVIGLIIKGKETEGLKYSLWLILSSLVIFFTTRYFMSIYFSGLFGS